MRHGWRLSLALILANSALLPVLVGSATSAWAQSFPGSAGSHYVQDGATTLNGTWTSRGTSEVAAQKTGGAPADSILVMEFGAPWYDGTNYGTKDWAPSNNVIHFSKIQGWLKAYGDSWYNGSTSSVHLTLVLATNTSVSSWLDTADGTHLGNAIDAIDTYLMNNASTLNQCRCDETTRIVVVGGSDMETGSGWGAPSPTQNYVAGYRGATNHHFFNTGDAGGCPQLTHSVAGNNCNNGWTQASVLSVSWQTTGTLVFPLPQIYCKNDGIACSQASTCHFDSQACQWFQLDLYSINNTSSGQVIVRGAESQLGTHPVDLSTANTPTQAWTNLYNALNSQSSTSQPLNYETDYMWGF